MKFIEVTVLGVRVMDYVAKSTGNHVQGKEVHFVFDDPDMIGGRVGTVFIPESEKKAVAPNQKLKLAWDNYNRQRPYQYVDMSTI